MYHRNVRATRDALGFDHRPIDAIEIPNVSEHIEKIPEPVRLTAPEDAPACSPYAQRFRPLQPDDEFRARQPKIETDLREISVAHPTVAGVSCRDQLAQGGGGVSGSQPLDQFVKADRRLADSFRKMPREYGFTAARAAQHQYASHFV